MKKNDIALIVGVILIIVISIFAFGNNDETKVELPLTLSGEETGTIEIDYSTYKSKVDNDENFIVVIERTGCDYCEMYMPVLEDATAELAIPVYYIDIANITEDEYNELSETNSYLKRNKKWGTPTTLLMSGDIVVDSISGYVEKEEFIEEIIDENVILSHEEDTDVE